MNTKWGFLRETETKAIESGVDADTGLCRTGLDTYLHKIFPGTEWVHDQMIKDTDGNLLIVNGSLLRTRPDYRCDDLMLIVEFDGIPHYTNPDVIYKDERNTKIYQQLGYTVIRIPYFIQLTTETVNKMFGTHITETLFPSGYPSLGPKGRNTPAYMCPKGLKRMAAEFKKYPIQYKLNVEYLKQYELEHPDETYLTEVQLLIDEYNKL